MDPSFEFEKRRNVPHKYNRELWQKTSECGRGARVTWTLQSVVFSKGPPLTEKMRKKSCHTNNLITYISAFIIILCIIYFGRVCIMGKVWFIAGTW